jgi:hypothetical protein
MGIADRSPRPADIRSLEESRIDPGTMRREPVGKPSLLAPVQPKVFYASANAGKIKGAEAKGKKKS